MIVRWCKNPLVLQRLRRFMALRRAVVSLWILSFFIFLSITAEFWASSKPIVAHYQGAIFFPVLFTYHPSAFKQDGFVTNYRTLDFAAAGNWALWPPIRWDPYESNQNLNTYPSPPSKDNWFGTDDRGRDVVARLIYGFRYSFAFAFLVWLITFFIGTCVGAIMGFCGGRIDFFGQRVVEVFDTLPDLLVMLTIVVFLGASLWTLILCQAFFLGWMRISMYMRAEFLRLRKREFVEAAKAQGLGVSTILFRHILPNGLTPLISFSPTEISNNIYILAVMDYLGMGLPPPTPSWGELLQQALNYFMTAWWLAFYPSMAMVITLISLTFIGEGVRAAFDPHAKA